MTRYFLGVSQEEFPPEALIEQAVAAEQAGFDGLSSSDHLQPWWEPGESGHTWPWLGAAGAATSKLPLGTGVTPTGARYHPALIAQAWVTLERLFPGRPFLGIGSGEALNEVPIGDDWPSVGDQIARMDEALSIIDRLWKGETITEEGRFYTLPGPQAAHAERAAAADLDLARSGRRPGEVAAKWGDGIWTLPDPGVDARAAGRVARRGRRHGEVVFQALFSWAPDDDAALEAARKWKGAQPQEHYKDDWHEPARDVRARRGADVRRGVQARTRSSPPTRRSTSSASASSRSSARP